MSSPLGLGFNDNNFRRGKANYRYDKVDKKLKPMTNSSGSFDNSTYEQSLFNEGSSLAYFPKLDSSGDVSSIQSPHSGNMGYRSNANSVYDVRTQSIIDWSQSQSNAMKLFAKDFAYLRYLGVYPNNRLIVCRKFGTGANNDLSRVNSSPVATILSWRVPGEDFFKINFGEEWERVEDGGFKDILNEIGKEFSGAASIGDMAGSGFNAVPLPGFTEIFQRRVMLALGLIDKQGANIIPSGNPNLIKESMRRKTINDDRAGSGLTCKISVVVKAEYEQKFIGGLDPTKAFYDILSNISHFGTQDAVFYLNGAGAAGQKFKKFLDDLRDNPRQAMSELLTTVITGLKDVVSSLIKTIGSEDTEQGFFSSLFFDSDEENRNQENSDNSDSLSAKLIDEVLGLVTGIVKKYEIRIMGVVNSLTGNPSGPWHVTIGNPKRPMFTSGDMVVKEVSITLGETLAFNDLPSKITAEFTLENARPLGLSEIMSRFMQGQGRTYLSGPSSWSEAQSGIDFNGSVISGTTSALFATASGSPIGGNDSGNVGVSDGSKNTGSTQSNQTYATGNGQESSINNEADPDLVRNPNSITDLPFIPPNDVKPDTTSVASGPIPISPVI